MITVLIYSHVPAGLRSITECVKAGLRGGGEAVYLCEVCTSRLSKGDMRNHIMGSLHRYNYTVSSPPLFSLPCVKGRNAKAKKVQVGGRVHKISASELYKFPDLLFHTEPSSVLDSGDGVYFHTEKQRQSCLRESFYQNKMGEATIKVEVQDFALSPFSLPAAFRTATED